MSCMSDRRWWQPWRGERASADSKWPGVAVRSGRDVDEPARFPHRDLVPHAFRHDDRVARAELDQAVTVGELEGDRDRTGDQVEQLVAVGVHLAVVLRFAGQLGCTDGEPV